MCLKAPRAGGVKMSPKGCSGPLGRGELPPHPLLGRWIVYIEGPVWGPPGGQLCAQGQSLVASPTCIPSSPSLAPILFGAKTLAEGTQGRGAYVSGLFGSLFLLSVDWGCP